ncbi:MAG TPA: type II secretion system protein GspJ [Thermodesulfobacteriota bacterium]|nr:type II secretion system protein GspJ [Thermodesulfobacteriota bacterium]
MSKGSGKERGFTLLEVLIAVGLMSVIIMALYGTLFPVLASQKRLDAEIERITEVSRFMDIFSSEVRSSFFKTKNPYSLWTGELIETGSSATTRLTFTTLTHSAVGGVGGGRAGRDGDLVTIRYSAEESSEGGITLYKEVWNPYTGGGDGGFKIGIIEDIEGFEVTYYDGAQWAGAWDAALEARAPEAVKVVLSVRDAGEVREFSTVARARIR